MIQFNIDKHKQESGEKKNYSLPKWNNNDSSYICYYYTIFCYVSINKKVRWSFKKEENSRIRWGEGRTKTRNKYNEECLSNFRIEGYWNA